VFGFTVTRGSCSAKLQASQILVLTESMPIWQHCSFWASFLVNVCREGRRVRALCVCLLFTQAVSATNSVMISLTLFPAVAMHLALLSWILIVFITFFIACLPASLRGALWLSSLAIWLIDHTGMVFQYSDHLGGAHLRTQSYHTGCQCHVFLCGGSVVLLESLGFCT